VNGINEYGVPLHACHGYRHDEHYWAWVRNRRFAQITREMLELSGMSLSDMHKRAMELSDPMRIIRRAVQQAQDKEKKA
jgi:hypothetical protein